ncbi:glycosyltransferase family 32 protein [Swaminathania salitolerans]|uniref:Glycosyl transferase n=1 Tax=Swaminathania salitolerans TaxID=182838 RepID=A0A511BMG2_9PROT|nr:glycosyltransferase [Swaminathania salitolerans]GBQ15900.1 hypothetical protein AA21291_2340 [Swaminathania salitolerans LMG 21291]GEL01529.1 hypothetical protein SSA02_06920 [Swaminathania salitolerans]
MTDTAFVTFFGDVLFDTGSAIATEILGETSYPLLGRDRIREGSAHAPHGVEIRRSHPRLYGLWGGEIRNGQIRDAHMQDAAAPRVFQPDGTVSGAGERQSWSELTCLALARFPIIAPASPDNGPIPRTLHFICNDRTRLDPALMANIETNAALNPGWTIHLWDEAARFQFISEHYGWEMLKIYLMIGAEYGAAKADFFRYLLIYAVGGVYLDLKSRTDRPLDTIIRPDDTYLLSQWNMSGSGRHAGWGLGTSIAHVPGGEYQQWFLIARKGHPYLRRVIQLVTTKILSYRPEAHGAGAVTTFNITGPHAYTKAIHPVRERFAHRVFDSESDGLVYSVLDNHRARSGSDYRKATTPLVTGNESYRI